MAVDEGLNSQAKNLRNGLIVNETTNIKAIKSNWSITLQ
jgi:hypothetical protein